MDWGYALVWPGSFLTEDPDPLIARLKFLVRYGLKVTGVGIEEIEGLSEARRAAIGQLVADHDLSLLIHAGVKAYAQDPGEVRRSVERTLALIERHRGLLRARLVATSGGGPHRFMRSPPLDAQLERLQAAMAPFAAGCRALGLPLGIENHGDYYCSDLVRLCQATPHLGIFLDTGNTYLIGEAPLPAFELAAPYVVGTHFKDHHVQPRPEARPLHFEVGNAVIGEGDVPLRACYDLLLKRAPDPRRLVMAIELIPPTDMDPIVAFERSLAFVRSLPEPE